MAGKTYKEYSGVSVSKRKANSTWMASLRWREVTEEVSEDGSVTTTKGKWHQLTKATGVKCVLDPDGTPKDKRNNRGRQTALDKADEWRASLIQADEDAETRKAEAEAARIEAECQRIEAEKEAERLAALRDSQKTVGEYAYLIVERKASSVEKSTIKGYRLNAKQIAEGFGDTLLRDLTPDMVSTWKKSMQERYYPTTAKKAFNFLKACLDEALEEGLIDRIPITKSIRKAPKVTQSKPNALDADGRKRLIALLKEDDSIISLAAQIALYAGLRRGEICALQWKNVVIERDSEGNPIGGDITVEKSIGVAEGTYTNAYAEDTADSKAKDEDATYTKGTKTNKVRHVPVHAELAKVLSKRRAQMQEEALSAGQGFNESLYVIGDVYGSYINPDVVSREWASVSKSLKRFNIRGTQRERITFHDLRHTFATCAMRENRPVKDIADILGHANAAMTLNVYTDSESEGQKDTINAVGDSMQGGRLHADVLKLNRTGTEG